jgi:hypothetical protein
MIRRHRGPSIPGPSHEIALMSPMLLMLAFSLFALAITGVLTLLRTAH